MAENGPNIDEAIRRYLSGLSEAKRSAQQIEIARFARWLGPGARLDTLKAEDVERYQEQFERTGADSARLEGVRSFLATAHKQGYSSFNLGKFIKIKRASAKKAATKAEAPTTVEDEHTQITREGYESLKQELEYLSTTKREEIARDLYEARIDKDFRENAPFDAAKQHQAEVENRIKFLERILAKAEIVEQAANGNRVGLGATVVLRDLTHGDEELTYTLVGTSEANPRLGRISIVSPVGKALMDRREGEEFEVEAPAGVIRYRVERFDN